MNGVTPESGGVRGDGFARNREYADRVTRDWPSWTRHAFGWSSASASRGTSPDSASQAGDEKERAHPKFL